MFLPKRETPSVGYRCTMKANMTIYITWNIKEKE